MVLKIYRDLSALAIRSLSEFIQVTVEFDPYGGPQLSQQQQITHSTNQDIHSNNKLLKAQTKIFTAITNNSQHEPKCSQRKSRNSQRKRMTHSTNRNVSQQNENRTLDLRTPGSLRPLRPRGNPPFKIKTY